MHKLVRTLLLLTCLISVGASKPVLENKSSKTVMALDLDEVLAGDTFIAGGQQIRLWGISAPDKTEPEFYASKLLLETILKDKFSCYYRYKNKINQYVMQCTSEKAGFALSDIASLLLRMGMAKQSDDARGFYDVDQNFAQENSYGIWK